MKMDTETARHAKTKYQYAADEGHRRYEECFPTMLQAWEAMQNPSSRIGIYERAVEKHKRTIKRLRLMIKQLKEELRNNGQ